MSTNAIGTVSKIRKFLAKTAYQSTEPSTWRARRRSPGALSCERLTR